MSQAPGLSRLFSPRSVAVVGASRSMGSVGGAVFRNLIDGGFTGTVYPVNPTANAVQGVRAYPRLAELPEVPDLVVVAVPAPQVEAVVEQAAERGAGAAVILSAGFGETGEAGRQTERRMLARARAAGMRLVGPNCLGVQNLDPAIRLNATFATTFGEPGTVAFASQSGALGLAALDHARDLGIGFSSFVSLGNKADLVCHDLLEHWEHDPDTRAVLLYLESFVDPVRLREIADRVGRAKPVIVVKAGRTGAGARAAGSHTGAMVGPDAAVSALCQQAGMLRVDTIEQLFGVAGLLADAPRPRGREVAVVTNAGGPGILAADALEAAGLTLPHLSNATQRALRQVLRPEASVANPVDVLADVTAEVYGAALQATLEDPAVRAVVALYVPPITGEAAQIAQRIAQAAKGTDKPILACFLGTFGVPEALEVLHAARVPAYRFPEHAAHALGLSCAYVEWLATPASAVEVVPPAPRGAQEAIDRARARLGDAGGWLNAGEVEALCDAWGIAVAAQRRVPPTAEAAEHAAGELGHPVVLKAEVPGLLHKSQAHAVVLGLKTSQQVRDAAARLLELGPEAFVVQPMISGGEEWLVGAVRHPTYGPLITVGAGGVDTELRRDVHNRLAPLSGQDLRSLLDEPRIGRTLTGWRGRPAGDRAALEKLVHALSWCACAHPELGELEANPVKVRPPGQGAIAVDVRVHLLPAKR